MKFSTVNPDTERKIIILCNNVGDNYMVQGIFYADEDDYYTHDGEILEGVIAWAELPEIEYI